MNRFRFPIAVGVTSLALVLIALGVGGLVVGNALANSPFMAAAAFAPGPWGTGPWGGNHGAWQLPPELSGLADVPADQRFSHFRGVQVSLTDKDNKPVHLDVVPGTVSSVNSASVTLATNDGPTRTFALDSKTAIHASGAHGDQSSASSIQSGDRVVVVSLNGSATATAVMAINGSGFGPHGPFGH